MGHLIGARRAIIYGIYTGRGTRLRLRYVGQTYRPDPLERVMEEVARVLVHPAGHLGGPFVLAPDERLEVRELEELPDPGDQEWDHLRLDAAEVRHIAEGRVWGDCDWNTLAGGRGSATKK